MTTTTTAAVTVPLTFTLLDWMHHGAGSSGNTSLLRTQEIVLPDGGHASVPFVSGNSLRHQLRDRLMWHAARVLGVGSLSKPVADLMWSGGALTRTGPETDLGLARRVEVVAPWLALFGFSAGSTMHAGTLAVDNLHLVCSENRWRVPERLASSPLVAAGAGAYRGEEFGTRHDLAESPVARLLDGTGLEPSRTAKGDDRKDTTQMIYDVQAVKPGAVMFGALHVNAAATDAQRRVLAVAVDEAAPAADGERRARLGAKAGTGYGACLLDVDPALLDPDGTARDWWEQHLAERRDEVLDLLGELTG